MAQFTLLPDGTTGTNNWECSTGSDFVDLVDEDDDSTYIYETAFNGQITYTFANPSVAESDIDFDEDVTVSAFAHAHYTDLGSAYSGTSGTVKSVGPDWDYTGLENLQMTLKCTGRPVRFSYLRVSYIFFTVDYTEAAVADNAIFFGSNF